MDRLWKKAGLRAQFTMLPHILKYLLRNIRNPGGIYQLSRVILPRRIYGLLVTPYRYIRRMF
jgi:hypothetical protein